MVLAFGNRFLGDAKQHLKGEIDPITVYKKSILYLDNGVPKLHAVSGLMTGIGLNESAECSTFGNMNVLGAKLHSAPVKLCTCGFYAYKDPEEAIRHNQGQTAAWDYHSRAVRTTFKVIASGKIIEHDLGYRYGHQRVEEIIIGRCVQCFSPGTHISLERSQKSPNHQIVTPTCDSHYHMYSTAILTFKKFEEQINEAVKEQYGEDFPHITVRSRFKPPRPPRKEQKTTFQSIKDSVVSFFKA